MLVRVFKDDFDNEDNDGRLQVWIYTQQRPNVEKEHGEHFHFHIEHCVQILLVFR